MRRLLAATMASALCLAASPAMAQSVTDAQANQMLADMNSSAFDFCTDSDKSKDRAPIEQYNACQTALAELAQTRRNNPGASAGQKEVYAFYEAAVEMGNTYAMLRVDEAPTARVCGNIEKQWVMANRANPNVVGPELRGAQDSTREAVRPLVKLCREKFAAPAGAIAI
ncbi:MULTISPECIES: hypothetical protein [unclassified Novosphingobium]|uniref:hypothetical protein n=1 Tax=unclassified Novosphingobium TaxID=2644732 RepID=UPI0025E47A9C|nr:MULTISPECIES: hypothetical protein [unclassified Novosphingobium]HQV04978.1 hypothetical protein [Novosphingobium sp.]